MISGDDEDTVHPKIRKMREKHPNKPDFDDFLTQLNVVCESANEDDLRELLSSDSLVILPPGETKIKVGELLDSLVIDNSVVLSVADNYQVNSATNRNLEENSDEVFAKNPELGLEAGIEKYRFGKRLFLSLLHRYFLITRHLRWACDVQ